MSTTKSSPATPAATAQRPNPRHPYPVSRPAEGPRVEKKPPLDLGPDSIAILEGRTFMCSNSLGDVPPGSIGGLLHNDTRFLSRWELTLGGKPLKLLKSSVVDYYDASFFLFNPELPALGQREGAVAVRRLRFVGDGVIEQIVTINSSSDPVRVELRLACDADFADLFEVRDVVRDRSAKTTRKHDDRALRFGYQVPGFVAETAIRITQSEIVDQGDRRVIAQAPPRIEGDDVVWSVELQPRAGLITRLDVTLRSNEGTIEPIHHGFGEQQQAFEGPLAKWLAECPQIESDSGVLTSVINKSIVDLAALRVSGEVNGEPYVMPAAGLPWFMTLFGRDTIIAALQTTAVGPELARGALHLLGEAQGKVVNDFRDEEPGRILHEIRGGELTVKGEKPHSPYYGTTDATPLWLILMEQYWQSTGDEDFIRKRWNRALAALNWIDHYGDRDGDGYVEYGTKSPQGLGNQCWKDSWDGIQFSDGRIPFLPIATVEIQGYVYDAKRRVANMARRIYKDEELAKRLEREADDLRERVNRDFWSNDRGGYYIVGLDGDKRPIDSMTSNMGHLLWSGIVTKERAPIIAKHLMSDHMFSGWGVRTLSSDDRGFNPIGYHCGTIWPHDNAIVADGLARYGFRDEANRIAVAQIEAASFSNFRLPEAFAGFDRSISRFPVPYPTACSPQAWATGAPFVFMHVMLGSQVRDGAIHLDPKIPEQFGRIMLRRVHALGTLWDIEAIGTRGHVRLSA
ncbi:MAG TPA: glycogen debranching N-terminal domain-containing protein [Vicinamibacterales bacterium]